MGTVRNFDFSFVPKKKKGTPVAIKKQLKNIDKDAMVYIQVVLAIDRALPIFLLLFFCLFVHMSQKKKREMETVKRLAHPNIVQFLGLAKHEDAAWVITEYCARGDLKHVLYDRAAFPLAWSQRIHFALDICMAVAFLHSKATMHRDIKSENVLLDEFWKAKLCDFGFATRVDKKLAKVSYKVRRRWGFRSVITVRHQKKLADTKKMKAMTIAGTDDFMAPEVILGMPYAFPADIFSFGQTLCEMILREAPIARAPRNAFEFETAEFQSRLQGEDCAGCPAEFSALVLACCVYNPAERPEAKMIVKGLRELHSLQLEREKNTEGAGAASSTTPTTTTATTTTTTTTKEVVASPRRGTLDGSLDVDAAIYRTMRPSMGSPIPTGLPCENHVMRGLTMLCSSSGARWFRDEDLATYRHRWVPIQDVPASALQQSLEVHLHNSKKKVKYHCVLYGNTFYYYRSNKKPEVNIGRILLDKSALISLDQDGKKNHVIRIVGWCGEEYRLYGKSAQLLLLNEAMQKSQQETQLDLNAVFNEDDARVTGRSAVTTGREVFVFPSVITHANVPLVLDQELLLCVTRWGVQFCNPFLEEIVFAFPFECAQKWSIQRNDMCEIIIFQEVPNKTSKKPPKTATLAFKCELPEKVYAALEAMSKKK